MSPIGGAATWWRSLWAGVRGWPDGPIFLIGPDAPALDPWADCSPEVRELLLTRPLRYPEFSGEDTPCRKCGTHRVDTRYQGANLPWTHVDSLLRVCCCCGFQWQERCAVPARVALEPEDCLDDQEVSR